MTARMGSSMLRKLAVRGSALVLLLLAVFLAQLLYFYAIIGGGPSTLRLGAQGSQGSLASLAQGVDEPPTQRIDLVLAFDGGPDRIPAAFREARATESPRIVFSSSQKAYIEAYPRKSRKRYHGLVSVVGGAYTT